MFFILDMLFKTWILEVDVCDAWGVLSWYRIVAAVLIISGRELFEFHDVLGERASFITEDVMHHAQLFVQVWGLDSGLDGSIRITNSYVLSDVESLNEVDHLQGDEHGNRYKVHDRYEPDACLDQYGNR